MNAFSDARFLMRCAAALLLLCTFLLPPVRIDRPVYDLIAVFDITGSMNTRDVTLEGASSSRLALEKRAVQRLLAALPCGSRLGLALFVERRPFLLVAPIETCGNFAALDEEIGDIDWRMGWDSESHIAIGLLAAMGMANAAGADLVFMTDGQETPPLFWTGSPSFAHTRGTANGLLVGLGGQTFAQIPRFDRDGREVGVWMPGDAPSEKAGLFRGHEHLSREDTPHLRALAAESGLTYLHLDGADGLMPALAQTVPRRTLATAFDVRFVAAGLALLLLAAADAWRAQGFGSLRAFLGITERKKLNHEEHEGHKEGRPQTRKQALNPR